MTSDRAYVWTWLPGRTDPVVAGVLTSTGRALHGQAVLAFTYAASYRARADALSLLPSELPLRAGTADPTIPEPGRSPLALHGCLRDGAPDAWGRRVLNLRLGSDPGAEFDELTYLLGSGSDRIGALDFQASPREYVPRDSPASLEDLLGLADVVERGGEVPPELAAAAMHGTSIGGARPKALLTDGGRGVIAKFPSKTDTRPVVKAEAAAMLLARAAGVDVAAVEVRPVEGRDVLLVDRFDREPGGARRHMVSTLTVLGYGELESRHASYVEIARALRSGPWATPGATLRELFTRLVVNVCVGNTDDHLRNHAAFFDGTTLRLTPAYDIAPQPRTGGAAGHAIGIAADGRRHSQLLLCREVAGEFLLDRTEATDVVESTVGVIHERWDEACDAARLTRAERATLWGREFLNPYVFAEEP
ncbi:MAG: HipA domain-containing protein [Kineosporiaceae bacterium]